MSISLKYSAILSCGFWDRPVFEPSAIILHSLASSSQIYQGSPYLQKLFHKALTREVRIVRRDQVLQLVAPDLLSVLEPHVRAGVYSNRQCIASLSQSVQRRKDDVQYAAEEAGLAFLQILRL